MSMTILDRIETIRTKGREAGKYLEHSRRIGVTYHWYSKFCQGKMKNPTIENISKVEEFFFSDLPTE
jgi:transcriptional regulator with XRE-family HTH domain